MSCVVSSSRDHTSLIGMPGTALAIATVSGLEIAPNAIACEILAGRRELGRDLRPVAIEFFGDELREAGECALAHFRTRNADDDSLVGPDHDPSIDFRRAVFGARAVRSNRGIEAESEPGSSGGAGDDEGAAIELGHAGHGCPRSHVGRGVDRRADLPIGAAAADVGDRRVDVGVRRLGFLLE